MPGFILTGYPSAGKTTVAQALKERALQHPSIENVVIINEESACPGLSKQECYATSLSEKKTRGALKTAFDQAIATSNKKTLVILDSLNYIKGFRYELHCLSKAAGERHGILWVLNQANVVEEWNSKRKEEQKETESFSPELLQELILRYEPPDERNRWDKPLYTVSVAPNGSVDTKGEAVQKSVYNMHALGDALVSKEGETQNQTDRNATRQRKPTRSAFSRAKRKVTTSQASASDVSEGVATSEKSAAAVTTGTNTSNMPAPTDAEADVKESPKKSLEEQLEDILVAFFSSKELRQGTSTKQHVAGSADVLAELDAITTRLTTAISSAQTLHTGGKLQVSLGGHTVPMSCPRQVALPELRRLRRQYIQWSSSHPPEDTSEKGIMVSFLEYIEQQIIK